MVVTIMYSPSTVSASAHVRLMTDTCNIVQPDISTAISISLANVLATVSDAIKQRSLCEHLIQHIYTWAIKTATLSVC